ncbi:hypothetical protein B0H14DRAFT_2359134 [Mycena olivaceomarginata]|nr:hypothetical protein B0H14DRAFT_2359134 [Mycena olivaceomarginata]
MTSGAKDQFSTGTEGLEKTSANAVAIDKLEIRVDTSSPVPHRFVMLYMRDHSVHRLDRRPNHHEILCHLGEGTVEEVQRKTKHEIGLSLEGKVDLKVVLSACFVISRDDTTKNYTLLAHNCFFFSWTILMIASRRYLPYAVSLEGQTLEQRVEGCLPELTTFIVEEFLNMLLDAVIDAMTIFRKTAGPEIQRGMHILSRALWVLPVDVIRFGARQALRARLQYGLRERLGKQVSEMLRSTTLRDIIVYAVRTEMIFSEQGGNIFNAITGDGGLHDIDSLELAKEVEDPTLTNFIFGRRYTQFHAVWNAVLHGALGAARDVIKNEDLDQIARDLADYGHGILDKSNRRVIDFTWNAARDGALAAAKAVVGATEDKVKHRKTRDPMWRAVWETWNPLWAKMQPEIGEKMITCINRIVEKMVDVRMDVVIAELGDSNVHFIMARVGDVSKDTESKRFAHKEVLEERKMNNESLQALMRSFMKKDTLNADKYDEIVESMSRLWGELFKMKALE